MMMGLMGQNIELIGFLLILIFSFLLYYVIFSKMRKEMNDFTWDQYFKRCEIYQGKSYWTVVKSYILRLQR